MRLTAEQVQYLMGRHSPDDPLLEHVNWLSERGVEQLPEQFRHELIGAGLLSATWPDQDSVIARIHPNLWRRLTDATVLPRTAEARIEAVRAVVGDILSQTPTTTHHQDARIEAAVQAGVEKVVGAVIEPLGEWLPPEARALLRVVPPTVLQDLESRARTALLDLLAAVGIDTSAHTSARPRSS